MAQSITIDDFVNTIIAFSGPRPLERNIRLNPFGTLDLGTMLEGHGAGKLYASRNSYVGQPIALQLIEETPDGFEPFADLTKCHPASTLSQGEVLVKTYSENDCLRQGLLDSGYFEDTGRRTNIGFCELEAWRVTPALIEAFAAANMPAIAATKRALQAA